MIPIRTFEITTQQPLEAVQDKLDEMIKPGITSREGLFKRTPKPFYGQIELPHFTVRRVIRYRNNFLPVLHGTLHDDLSRRRITVTAKLPTLGLVVFTLLTLFIIATWLAGLSNLEQSGTVIDAQALLTFWPVLLVVVLAIAVTVIMTVVELNKAERLLREGLEGMERQP